MISRRNIRVKVMQTLYSIETQAVPVKPGDPVKLLLKQFDQSRQLLVYLVHFLTEVARYAETDARNRASKHLPSKQDLSVNIKLSGNSILWKILEHSSYLQAITNDKPERITDPELVKSIYQDLTATDRYQDYIGLESREKKDERDIMEFIFTELMLPNEHFTSQLEEKFSNWDDDGQMINQLVLNFIAKPTSFNFQEIISKEKMDFSKLLLETTIDKKEVAMDYIKPKLKNWEAERIAVLDMVLMRMGVSEFLFFETIPPKVTINEYIDLAKEYSTQQSGQFVNGILDNIHKELVKDNKMHKTNYKPS
jgi:transcription antitermination protein NusB